MLKRIILDLLLFLSILLFVPWWATVFFAVVLAFYFKHYYELIVVGFIIDALYGIPQIWFFNIEILFGLISIFTYIFIEFLKKKIRYYN